MFFTQITRHNNVLIRSGEAAGIGWSRNMLYSGLITLLRSVIRRQTVFAARITRTLSTSNQMKIPRSLKITDSQLDTGRPVVPGDVAVCHFRCTRNKGDLIFENSSGIGIPIRVGGRDCFAGLEYRPAGNENWWTTSRRSAAKLNL